MSRNIQSKGGLRVKQKTDVKTRVGQALIRSRYVPKSDTSLTRKCIHASLPEFPLEEQFYDSVDLIEMRKQYWKLDQARQLIRNKNEVSLP